MLYNTMQCQPKSYGMVVKVLYEIREQCVYKVAVNKSSIAKENENLPKSGVEVEPLFKILHSKGKVFPVLNLVQRQEELLWVWRYSSTNYLS